MPSSETKRLGLLGDVHSEDAILEAALGFLSRQGLDHILCVGDLADGKGDLDRCVELLARHRVITVRGNHDRWILADTMRDLEDTQRVAELAPRTRDYLAALPPIHRLDTAAGPLLLCHGLGTDDMRFVNDARELTWELQNSGYSPAQALARVGIDPDIAIVVNGHTHARWAARVGELALVNAGTLRRTDCPCFAVLDVSAPVCRVQYFDVGEGLDVTAAEALAV